MRLGWGSVKEDREDGVRFNARGNPVHPFWPFTENGEGIEEALWRRRAEDARGLAVPAVRMVE